MAIFTRTAGDALPVVNVDTGLKASPDTTGVIIAPGLTKTPTAIKIVLANSQVFNATEMNTGGAVEKILRSIGIDNTIVMYQVEAGAQMSVLVESTDNTAAAITRIQSLGNVGLAANVFGGPGVAVTTSAGFKIA